MDKVNELKSKIEGIFQEELTLEKLNELKIEYLGKKGLITELNAMIKELPNEEKKEFGKSVNELRTLFNTKYEKTKEKLELEAMNKKLENERIDITLPSKKVKRGSLHPMTRIQNEFEDIYLNIAFIRSINEEKIIILPKNEYDARINEVINSKCVTCANYKTSQGCNRDYKGYINLDGECFQFEEKSE